MQCGCACLLTHMPTWMCTQGLFLCFKGSNLHPYTLQVRSFAKEKASTDRYGGAQDQVVNWGLQSARASGFFFGFNSLVGTGSIVFVLWFGARQVSICASASRLASCLAGFVIDQPCIKKRSTASRASDVLMSLLPALQDSAKEHSEDAESAQQDAPHTVLSRVAVQTCREPAPAVITRHMLSMPNLQLCRPHQCLASKVSEVSLFPLIQVVEGKLSAGELSSFVIYALYVGGNVGSLASVISNLIQVSSGKPLCCTVKLFVHAGQLHLQCRHSASCIL